MSKKYGQNKVHPKEDGLKGVNLKVDGPSRTVVVLKVDALMKFGGRYLAKISRILTVTVWFIN